MRPRGEEKNTSRRIFAMEIRPRIFVFINIGGAFSSRNSAALRTSCSSSFAKFSSVVPWYRRGPADSISAYLLGKRIVRAIKRKSIAGRHRRRVAPFFFRDEPRGMQTFVEAIGTEQSTRRFRIPNSISRSGFKLSRILNNSMIQ